MYNVYMLRVWTLAGGELAMSPVEGMTLQRAKQFYEYHKLIVGKTAAVHCFFEDYDIRDEDLKKMATAFMKGLYTRYNIDLKEFKWTEEGGIDLTHPRY